MPVAPEPRIPKRVATYRIQSGKRKRRLAPGDALSGSVGEHLQQKKAGIVGAGNKGAVHELNDVKLLPGSTHQNLGQ